MKLTTLREIFASNLLRVPDYQRTYAWSTEHRRDLLDDLEDLEVGAASHIHFTGTIVLHDSLQERERIGMDILPVRDLVDGQQRLTTLLILVACAARALWTLPGGSRAAQDLLDDYLVRDDYARLRLQESSHQAFLNAIIHWDAGVTPTSPADMNLLQAKTEFCQYLESRRAAVGDAHWPDALARFTSLVTSRMGFLVHEVESEAEVGVMFEVMNSRGRPLTNMEKVKNLLLYEATRVCDSSATLRELSHQVNETWRTVTENLYVGAVDDEDQFLRYHWVVFPAAASFEKGGLDHTSDVHKAIKASLAERSTAADRRSFITEYLRSLSTFSVAYRDLEQPTAPTSFAFARDDERAVLCAAVQSIRRIQRAASVMPLLMAGHVALRSKTPALLEILRLAEVFAFRLMAEARYSNTGQSQVYRIGRDLSAGADPADVQDRLGKLIEGYCTDQQLRAILMREDQNFYEWRGLRTLLFEYERHLVERAGQKFIVDWDQFYRRDLDDTIEHVLPQGERTLDVPYWRDHFSGQEWSIFRHNLGNLSITNWNSHYGNKPFPEKRGDARAPHDVKVYRNSQWRQEQELADSADWSVEEIKKRQRKLVEFAVQRWHL